MKKKQNTSMGEEECLEIHSLITGDAVGTGCDSTVPITSQVMYGRNAETLTLLRAYQRLLVTEQAQTVIVHGESGSGKTTLVDSTLRGPVFDANNYFVTCKFVQQLGGATLSEPGLAIMPAFFDLCNLVVQSDDHEGDPQRRRMREFLGAYAQLLGKLISNQSKFLDNDDTSEIESTEASSFAQFKMACSTFLRSVVASEKRPIVIFLDDIQWADEGSMQLIQMFLREDSALDNIMFVLAYRDEEAEHVFESGVLGDGVRYSNDIPLSNLNVDDVHQLVVSMMGSSTVGEIRQLSDLVARRTAGNPLHVTMFMEAIQQDGLLTYDKTTHSWTFDLLKIQYESMVSESLADVLTQKVEWLSNDLISTLKIASLLGYHFSESILLEVIACMVTGESPGVLRLSEAVQEGFIEKKDHDGYHFIHNKVQPAFKSLIDDSDGARLHLLIGKVYLNAHDNGGGRSNIYMAAVHLSCAPDFLSNHQEQRVRLARINLEAAKYCMEISAFEQAVVALKTGLDVLSTIGKWSDEHSALTFEMMETQARMQIVVGDFEACKATALEASYHATTAETKATLLGIDVEVLMAGNEIDAGAAAVRRGLRALGFKIPHKAKLRHILAKLAKVKFMLRGESDENLLNLPLTRDQSTANVVKFLIYLCTFSLMQNEKEMTVFSALLATELTLKNGMSPYSPCAFALYGATEAYLLGNISRGYRFGKLALVMLDRIHSKGGEGPTVAYALTFLSCLKEPFNQMMTSLCTVADSRFQHGDIVYATYCMSQCHSMRVSIGENLASAEFAMRATYDRVYELGQTELLRWLQPILQYVVNMQANVASWENIAVLTGVVVNEEAYLNESVEKNNQIQYWIFLAWKATVAADFGQFSLADSIWENCRTHGGTEVVRHSWAGPVFYFSQALVKYGIYEITGEGRQLREGRRYRRVLQRMHAAGRQSANPFLAYLVAHEESLRKKNTNLSALRIIFKTGIDCLVATEHIHLEGLLCERAGFCFTGLGLRSEADFHFKRALHIYRNEWGATAKYNQLKQTSEEALSGLHGGSATDDDRLELTGMCIFVPQCL